MRFLIGLGLAAMITSSVQASEPVTYTYDA